MGDSRPDGGGGWPPDDSFGGLPDLPPEWGSIVIPDDASELDFEAYALRRELRRKARRARGGSRWTRRAGEHGRPEGWPRFGRLSGDSGSPSVAVPLVIMAVAILTTLVSLFVVTWGRQGTTPTPATPAVATQPSAATTGAPAVTAPAGLANLVLSDEVGHAIMIGPLLPAIVLLLDSCECPGLVRDVAATAPAGVRVLAVGATAPAMPNPPKNVVSLADPDAKLRGRHATGTTGTGATALVVDHAGKIVVTVPGVTAAKDLPPIDAIKLN